jgi:hypothetical protein
MIENFVYICGDVFPKVGKLPKEDIDAPHMCFRNSGMLAISRGYQYCEGFVMPKKFPLAIHHAWCLDKNGVVLDPTLADADETSAYMGIAMSASAWNSEIGKNKNYPSVLAPNDINNFRFMTQWAKKHGKEFKGPDNGSKKF